MVTQDEAFRGGQEPGTARGVGANTRPTGNIAQSSFIQSNAFSGILGSLSEIATDRDKRALGADLEKAKDKLITVNNPVTQQVMKTNMALRLAKIHGAASLGLIKQGLDLVASPSVRVNLNKGTLLINTPDGRFVEQPIQGANNPAMRSAETFKKIGARFASSLPGVNKLLNDIAARSNEYRAKNGLPSLEKGENGQAMLSAMVDWANPVSAFEKAQATITALRQNPQWRNLFGTEKYTRQVYNQAMGTMWLSAGRFLDKHMMEMLGNRRAYNITDSQMSAVVGQWGQEMTAIIQRFGAMTGMDQAEIAKATKGLIQVVGSIQQIYTSQYQGRARQVALQRSELALYMEAKNVASIKALSAKMEKTIGIDFWTAKNGASTFQRLNTIIGAIQQIHKDLGGKVTPRFGLSMMERFARGLDLYNGHRKNIKEVMDRGVKSPAEGLRLYRDMTNMLNDPTSWSPQDLAHVKSFAEWFEREKKGLGDNKFWNSSMIHEMDKKLKAILGSLDKYDKERQNSSKRGETSGGAAALSGKSSLEIAKEYMGIFGGMGGLKKHSETGGF